MNHRRNAGIFVILTILLYLAYAYWGLGNSIVLVLTIISALIALYSIVMMFARPGKPGQDRGASS